MPYVFLAPAILRSQLPKYMEHCYEETIWVKKGIAICKKNSSAIYLKQVGYKPITDRYCIDCGILFKTAEELQKHDHAKPKKEVKTKPKKEVKTKVESTFLTDLEKKETNVKPSKPRRSKKKAENR